MARCAFGKVALNSAWHAECPFGTDLDGRFLYVADGGRSWLLAVFDVCYMFRRTSLAWRRAVAEATGIPLQNIWFHELQTHSAPEAPALDGEPCRKMAELSLPVIRRMMAEAEEAEFDRVLVDLGERFNMNREQYIPGLGAVTVWTGCKFDERDRPYTQDPAIMLLEEWKPDLPAFSEKIYFDRPADPQAALLVFRNRAGKVLGTLARFAAHADIVAACVWDYGRGNMQENQYHFDWPGYLRQGVESALGGVGIAVCGPCGNLSTKKRALQGYAAGDRQAREFGGGVAGACLAAWQERPPAWQPLILGETAWDQVWLPMRAGFPRSRQELEKAPERARQYAAEYKAAIADKAPAYRIKQLIDEYLHWVWVPLIVDRWVGLAEEEMRDQRLAVELEAVRLNDLVLAGLPGESMAETCLWLRAQSLGQRLVVLDQVNGYCSYQTTGEQYRQGAYSYASSCLAREATAMTRMAALNLIRKV